METNEEQPKKSKSQLKLEQLAIERYIERREKFIEKAEDIVKYAVIRFDLLVISLSTGAILLLLNHIKPDKSYNCLSTAKTACLFFTICIIANLLSQVSSYFSNGFDIKIVLNQIKKKKGKEIPSKDSSFESWCKCFQRLTMALNFISLLTFITGIVCLLVFFNLNIYSK